MNIIGIESIIYGVTDVEICCRYLTDWGLELVSKNNKSSVFETLEKTTINLRKADDPELAPLNCDIPFFEGSCGREVIWGVDNEDTLASIRAELSKDRDVRETSDGTLHAVDDANNPLGFCVSKRTVANEIHPAVNSPGNPARINTPADGAIPSLAVPARIGHVVYSVSKDVEKKVEFYFQRLGFKLSDRIGDGGFFMRPAGSKDHHNLLLEGHGGDGLQHTAFELRDFDQVMQRGLYMEEQGWQTHIGPTRHTVGSNYSWYLWAPVGGLFELISDMDILDDNWKAGHADPKKLGPPFSWYARPEQKNIKFGQPHE